MSRPIPASPPASRPPAGFRPAEISALRNQPVIAEHASEAAFLWTLRRQAVHAPHYGLEQLARLDERVVAHLAGLRVAGDTGWRAALSTLADGGPGAVFSTSYLAFARSDADGMRHVLALATAEAAHGAAFTDALAWLPTDTVRPGLRRLAASPLGVHRALAAMALGAHPEAAGLLVPLLGDPDPAVRARAARATAAVRPPDTAGALAALTSDTDPEARFWAARALAMTGDTTAARTAFDTALAVPHLAPRGVETGLRFGEADWARDTLRALAADPSRRRLAIHAAGALGDPATLPWLVSQCADPAHAAVAGEALSLVTGVDLALRDLDTDRPDTPEADHPADADLPWPDGARVADWWAREAPRLAPGVRHLGGEPVSAAACARLLRTGYQRQRAAAALELGRLFPDRPVFDIEARADLQRAKVRP